MRQRRRAERGHYVPRAPAQGATHRQTERAQQRLLVLAAAAIVLLLIGVLSVGWYQSSFVPPRRVIAEVSGQPVHLRDLVAYSRLDAFASGQFQPDATLNSYMRDIILRLHAGTLGVTVTPAAVGEALARQFEPFPDDPATDPSTVLGPDGDAIFAEFVEQFEVSKSDYRARIEGQLFQEAVFDHFLEEQPDSVEQVFVHWIVARNSVDAQTAFDRVDAGEPFGVVAADLNIERAFAAENGEVGWVPRGAFVEFEGMLFDEDLELNEPIGPLVTTIGSVVLQVTDGPSEQPLVDQMRALVAQAAFQDWTSEQAAELVDIDFTDDDRLWLFDQLGLR